MKRNNLFTHLFAEVHLWRTTIRTSLATRRALFIARWRTRLSAIKVRLVRHKKILLWSAIILATAMVATVALIVLSRRSSGVIASLTSVMDSVSSLPSQIRAWFRAQTKRRIPVPIRAIAGPPRDNEVTFVAAEAEEIPAISHLDGRV
jgi:hypothetical protein